MAINYGISTAGMRISVHPREPVSMDVVFLFSYLGTGDLEAIGASVRRAIIDIGGEIEIVRIKEGYRRCFYCGEQNQGNQESCTFCGKSV